MDSEEEFVYDEDAVEEAVASAEYDAPMPGSGGKRPNKREPCEFSWVENGPVPFECGQVKANTD